MKKQLLLLLTLSVPVLSFGQNVMGRITANGVGVPNVMVSDGEVVTQTDADGQYSFTSTKHYPYVFYSLPRGYRPQQKNGFVPLFWQSLDSNNKEKVERHNFMLFPSENDNYQMIIGADSHLANRTGDLNQFKDGYVTRIRQEKSASPDPVYSMILGDLTWDNYWYSRKFNLADFYSKCTEFSYPVILWPVIGNHDNDGGTAPSNDTDFLSAQPWRKTVAPTFYSFNLGRVHYVVLDDIYYKNEDTGGSYNTGIVGSRNYDALITDDQFEWLEKDLALVEDKDAPLVIAMHIPTWALSSSSPYTPLARLSNDGTNRLCKAVKQFSKVHIVTGHTHYNYVAHPKEYPNVTEHNIAAICATWWWTGQITGHHVCKDGSPGGYSMWTVRGDEVSWKYHSIEDNGNMQMRIYDMNTVKDYFANDENAKKFFAVYPSRTTYSSVGKNVIYINVFGYDTDWKIEVFESKIKRSVSRVRNEDPFHTIAYDVPRTVQNGSCTADFSTNMTSHLFQSTMTSATLPVTVRVTDSFGRVFVQSIERPHPFNLDMEKLQLNDDLTDVGSTELTPKVKVYSPSLGQLCIESPIEQPALIVLPDGTFRRVSLQRGSNMLPAGHCPGICIIKVGEGTKKVMLR
ncbi:MAG: calcineurin-like phosphoesterase family protein [Bacteroidaceae bacterium]|nr:calcineurin-like phosphoesterase family protein [Bacteroidaceae bacterium]